VTIYLNNDIGFKEVCFFPFNGRYPFRESIFSGRDFCAILKHQDKRAAYHPNPDKLDQNSFKQLVVNLLTPVVAL